MLPSTQDAMRERLARGEPVSHLVIRADVQTEGRGQRARDWLSTLGGSYQTVAIQDATLQLQRPYAAIVMALGIAETFTQIGSNMLVKWPNDLYYTHKKVGGILCEYTQNHLLIGVGINVQNQIPERAAALSALTLESVHQAVLRGIAVGIDYLQCETDISRLFSPYDELANRQIRLTVNGQQKAGVARGITPDGCLKLETAKGLEVICHHDSRSPIE